MHYLLILTKKIKTKNIAMLICLISQKIMDLEDIAIKPNIISPLSTNQNVENNLYTHSLEIKTIKFGIS